MAGVKGRSGRRKESPIKRFWAKVEKRIAESMGVSPAAISMALNGKTWAAPN